MANGRVITRRITTNEQLGRVSWKADLLFTKAIPHLDVEGRISGNPKILKSQVVPLRDEITERDIPALLAELEQSVGHEGDPLVRSYVVGGVAVLQFPGFGRIQTVRRDREATSKLPPPPGVLRESSGSPPPQGEGEVQAKGDGGAGLRGLVGEVVKVWNAETGGSYVFGRAMKEVEALHGHHSTEKVLVHLREYFRQHQGANRKFVSLPRFVSTFGIYAPAGSVPEEGGDTEARYQYLAAEARRGVNMEKYPDWPRYEGRYLGREGVGSGQV